MEHLDTEGYRGRYQGFDISAPMIRKARELHGAKGARVVFTTEISRLHVSDYTVASGVFNVKLKTPDEEWREYVLHTLHQIVNLSRYGFAFNVLSSYTPYELREDDLFYADPFSMFEYCKKTFSDSVTLFHDYPLLDFTVFVNMR